MFATSKIAQTGELSFYEHIISPLPYTCAVLTCLMYLNFGPQKNLKNKNKNNITIFSAGDSFHATARSSFFNLAQ